ncbi:hypothetical protein X737_32900 [Mesorhizobium sp. L48C026A00]|nr:hypothetical protein X737_32900 [Mesorhizobium sp. L48C026A00]
MAGHEDQRDEADDHARSRLRQAKTAELRGGDAVTATAVDWGNFSATPQDYAQRPAHAPTLLHTLKLEIADKGFADFVVDLCAGTGNLTATLASLGLGGYAIEPEAEMRREARRLNRDGAFQWRDGYAEATGLPDNTASWILIGNALQFVDAIKALEECSRILKAGGFLTVLWNPRDIRLDAFQREIDQLIREACPAVRHTFTDTEAAIRPVEQSGHFRPYLYCERTDWHEMSVETFMATWRGAHYVPSQIGPQAWRDLLQTIAARAYTRDVLRTGWRTRAWTFRVTPPDDGN